MATLNPSSSFQSWILTEQELLQGSILTITQKQCVQNQIVQLAQERLSLAFDPEHPLLFLQREAEIKGSISALEYLIILSNEQENKLIARPNPQEM